MMLLDGSHNRNRYGSIQAPARKATTSTKSTDVAARAGAKAGAGHDIAACLSRVVASIRNSAPNESPRPGENKETASGNLSTDAAYKSTLDKLLNEKFLKNRYGGGYPQQCTRSVKQQLAQQQWIPSVRGNLSRSFSLQQRKIDTSKFKLKYQFSTDNFDGNKNRSCKNDVLRSCKQATKRTDNSWLSGINKFSVASLLSVLACLILLAASTDSAPLPQKYSLNPIWLTDGLINLDLPSEGLGGDDSTTTSIRTDLDIDSSLRQALLDILVESLSENGPDSYQPDTLGGENRKTAAWSQFDGGVPMVNTSLLSSEPSVTDQFWVQRRRLERDRALEPPPWLRAQPMRRANNYFLDNNLDAPIDQVSESGSQENPKGPILGRQSRQSSKDVYDEMLRYLVEEALQGQEFLSEIYDELERRTKINNPQSSLESLGSDGGPMSQRQPYRQQKPQSQLQQQQQQQLRASNQLNLKSGSDRDDLSGSRDQDNADPNEGLVVIGDEVSSGDGPAFASVDPSVEGTAINDDKAAYVQQAISSVDHLQSAPSVRDVLLMKSQELRRRQQQQQQPLAPMAADQFGSQLRMENSPYSFEIPAAEVEPQVTNSRYSSSPSQQEQDFHVPEEIDQVDDSQQSSLPQLSASQNADEDDNSVGQSSRFVADWLNTIGDSDASMGLDERDQLTKRNTFKAASTARSPGARDWPASPAEPVIPDYKASFSTSSKWLTQPTTASSEQTSMRSKESSIGGGAGVAASSAALRIINSGYLSKQQLVQVESKLKSHLEDTIDLPEGSVLALYPINPQQLLIKLDTSKLNALQMMDMIQNYGKSHHISHSGAFPAHMMASLSLLIVQAITAVATTTTNFAPTLKVARPSTKRKAKQSANPNSSVPCCRWSKDFARGFIVLSWPRGNQMSPPPILVAILNQLVSMLTCVRMYVCRLHR